MNVKVGIADDQQLFLKSLSILINTFTDFEIVLDALNGQDLLNKLEKTKALPDIILLDVSMPILDGISTSREISLHYPSVKTAALSMNDDDFHILKMLRTGCCAYLLKDIHPDELEKALKEIFFKGYYNADALNIRYRRLLLNDGIDPVAMLNDRERVFLQYACSDLTYKQIADKMNLAERTIDGYRESIFGKFNVQSRVGMALEAVRRKLVTI